MLFSVARPEGAEGHRHNRHQEDHERRRVEVNVSSRQHRSVKLNEGGGGVRGAPPRISDIFF